jgi:DNA mismatch repair ATPase MutS
LALAYATLQKVVEEIRPRMLFTTYYHILLEELARLAGVEAWHMSAQVQGSQVTFLYKLQLGVCPSYAMNVARMVGLTDSLIARAEVKTRELDREMKLKQLMQLWKETRAEGGTAKSLRELVRRCHLT